jgi:hypothetical protein
LFTAFQRRQPFHDNFLRPCQIIDAPEQLRMIAQECGMQPTYPGADGVLQGRIADELDERSARWGDVADQLWAERYPSGAMPDTVTR